MCVLVIAKKRNSRKNLKTGPWSRLIVPTILDFLSGNNKEAVGLETPLLNGSSMHSIVDGRSMLMRPPSSNRLTFSINNPGDIMVLRDKSYVITVPIASSRLAPHR